ncbi:MAG: BACON domain-containing protein [Syntrophales bacterium LBB04]|nr:BACON domain-containing protein [Syntrophales bacterium LBB04]
MKRRAGLVLFATLLMMLMGTGSYGEDTSCTFSVSPATVYFQLPGGTAEVYVKGSAPTCSFSARSAYPWITVSAKQEQGEGKVSVVVDGNTGLTHRVGSLLIDGEEVSIVQYGPRLSGGGN